MVVTERIRFAIQSMWRHFRLNFQLGRLNFPTRNSDRNRLVQPAVFAWPDVTADAWKPSKKKSVERIDGIVALIMALDRATRHAPFKSVYEEHGMLTL